MTTAQLTALRAIGAIILEAIPEHGAPNGPLYAALMSKLSLSQYQSIIGGLKQAQALNESGYYFTRGPAYAETLAALSK